MQDAPIVHHLAPGASEEEIDRLQELAGVVLPEVARELYRWHNGATSNGANANSWDTAFGACVWQFLSLAEITNWLLGEWRPDNLKWAQEFPEYKPEGPWPRHWFPLFRGNASAIVVRCYDRREVEAARVALAYYRDDTPDTALTHLSLVSLLQTWLMWFDLGVVRWDGAERHWRLDQRGAYDLATYRSAFW